jgi:hypothetical protein
MFTRAKSAPLARLEVSLALAAGLLLWADLSFHGLALCLCWAILSRTQGVDLKLTHFWLLPFWCTALVDSIATPGVAWHKFN